MTRSAQDAHRPVYRIQFSAPTDMGAVEEALLMAILAVGYLHGEAAVRLETGYAISADERVVVLHAAGPLAQDVARVFVGICTHEFGPKAFRVLRGRGAGSHGMEVAATS